jgi:elongation factor Ts
MMDCKNALTETGGDIEAAVDWLRKKGLSKAAKKSGRVAAEGLVAVAVHGHDGVVAEVNSETDFVARNETFQGAARQIAEAALKAKDADVETLRNAPVEGGQNAGELIAGLIATIGENMTLRRAARLHVEQGAVGSYVHNKVATNLGRMGVIVAVEGAGDVAVLEELANNIALHAAGHSPPPLSLSADELDPVAVEKEREIQTATAAESGKPPNVVEKMVEGRIRKWMEEVVLLKQAYVKNPDLTVEQLVAETAKQVGSPIKVVAFTRLALGEGVEKKTEDFAAEVAALTAGS